MNFRDDTRGVSALVGAMFLFFFVVLALSGYQTAVVPNQNADIEAQHYTDVQGDMESVRSALINAGESGEKRSAVVSLGTTYPGRIVAMNSAPPFGSFSTTEVGDGQYESTDVDLENVCGLGAPDSVETKALDYSPGYNYFDGGNFDHRIESTLLYQATDSDSLARVDQTIVGERTVTLYPVQGGVSEQGIAATTVEFTGNATGGERVSPDFTITIPTRVDRDVWEARIDHSDVTVADGGTDEVDLTFEGSDDWTVLCKPVGVNQDLQGQLQPSPPPGEGGGGGAGGGGHDPNDGSGTGAGAGQYTDLHDDSTEVVQEGSEGGIWDNVTSLDHVNLSQLHLNDPYDGKTDELHLEFDISNKTNDKTYEVDVRLRYDWDDNSWHVNEVTITDPSDNDVVDSAAFQPSEADSIYTALDGSGEVDLVGNESYAGDPWESGEIEDFRNFAGTDTYIESIRVEDGSLVIEID